MPRRSIGPRWIGAVGGLAPAGLVPSLFVISGVVSGRWDNALATGVVAGGAIVIGWLAGPAAMGSYRSDLVAFVAYALVAALVYLVIASVKGAWIDLPDAGHAGFADRLTRMVGQLGYGLLYLPFWAAFVAPFAFAWVVAIRVLRRRVGPTAARVAAATAETRPGPGPLGMVHRQRIALPGSAVILGYGLFVAPLPFALYDDPRPPWWIHRPIALFGLFGVPAVVASIGAVRGSRPLLVAAGVLCLLQAYIAFSGVTIGFVVPAILLLVLGGSDSWSDDARGSRAELFAGVAVLVLAVGAWVSLFALTEPRCYVISRTAGGALVTTEVPATDRMIHGPIQVQGEGSGCSSAELTVEGKGMSAVLAIGAIAFAAVAASTRQAPDPS